MQISKFLIIKFYSACCYFLSLLSSNILLTTLLSDKFSVLAFLIRQQIKFHTHTEEQYCGSTSHMHCWTRQQINLE
jgi:hypothetical protein